MNIIEENERKDIENAVRVRRAELKTMVEKVKDLNHCSRPTAAMTVLLDCVARLEVNQDVTQRAVVGVLTRLQQAIAATEVTRVEQHHG
jgi:hypothetical protein